MPERPTSPPKFVRCGPLQATHDRLGGFWGACPGRGCLGYVTERIPEAHKLRELSAYAISVTVLAKLDTLGVSRVFVAEMDTGTILEYRIEQFLKEGEPVPDKYLHDIFDPQRFAGTELAAGRWEGGMADFYLATPVDEFLALQSA